VLLNNQKMVNYLSIFRMMCYDCESSGTRVLEHGHAAAKLQRATKSIRADIRRENAAKRNKHQRIENKRFREMADSTPSMISMTCSPRRETIHFAQRNEAPCFHWLCPPQRNETNEAGWLPGVIARRVQRDGDAGVFGRTTFPGRFAAPLVAITARRVEKVAQKRT
jgi:hypothetical protein